MQKNPYGYGPGHGTGVSCPIGLGVIAGTGAKAEPAGGYSAFTSIPGLVVDAHGEQNGAVYQEVTLGRSDIAPVSLLAEDRADVLELLINGNYGDHCSHLHPQAYHHGCMAGAGALVLTVGRPPYPWKLSVSL